MIKWAVIVWILPLLSFFFVLIFNKKLPRGGDYFSLGTIFIGLFLSVKLFTEALLNGAQYSENWSFTWIPLGKYSIQFDLHFDIVTAVMFLVVTIVSSLVHLYSVGYMKGDPKYGRFFAYLSIFSFSMLGLVLSGSLIGLYIFWELVGLSSYLLIGFWHERHPPAEASKKAFITNRVGDVGMLLGILITFAILGDLNIHSIGEKVAAGKVSQSTLTLIGLLLFCGAVGKSAQFPLHVWLPDAMEGPTPVSALIHAATMVAAGVYLVARIFPLLTPEAGLIIAFVGGFTAFFAATIAIAQYDIKKVLAYSTVSQLGYMIMALGVGSYTAGLFHLTTHAFFKACLFLCSGSVIHAMHHSLHHIHSHADPQDMRNMGGMKKKMPITFWTMFIATIAISGVPFTSGFLSKDAILGGTLAYAMEHGGISWILVFFGFVTAGMTAFYMFRILFKTFYGEFRSGPKAEEVLHESPKTMTIPLILLAVLSFYLWFTLPNVNPFSTHGWYESYTITPEKAYEKTIIIHNQSNINLSNTFENQHQLKAKDEKQHSETFNSTHSNQQHSVHHSAHILAMISSLIVAGLGILISWLTFYKQTISSDKVKSSLGAFYQGMYNKWWIDEIYEGTVIQFTMLMTKISAWFDTYIIDGIVNGTAAITRVFSDGTGIFDNRIIDGLVNGLANTIGWFGKSIRKIQTGNIQRYLLSSSVVLGVVLLIIVVRTIFY
ncbi:MAG: NADH-quinone oxidoreductase subunit L [bacterium]|nr:NADH-quinone oxidoreductase subunit L [bacterium]